MQRFIVKWIVSLLLLSFTISANAATDSPQVLIHTNLGDMTVELDRKHAPKTVDNFLRYVDEEFYNGTVFHRVINGFMIQGGGFSQDYSRKHTHDPVTNEADNGLKNQRGTLAMARTSDPHSATAQFFINHVDNDFLNYRSRDLRGWGYTVFGKVTKGMEVVDKIADQPTKTRGGGMQNVPEKPVIIEAITRVNPDK